jgi:hypothetical protein
MNIAATPDPIGAAAATTSRAVRRSVLFGHVGERDGAFGIFALANGGGSGGFLRGGAFGHGGVPRFLTMQLDHRGLALLAHVGPQACALALLRRVAEEDRLAADQPASGGDTDADQESRGHREEPCQRLVAGDRLGLLLAPPSSTAGALAGFTSAKPKA